MARLYQITLLDGSCYITREASVDEFHKSKIYKFRSGCVVVKIHMPDGGINLNMFDLSVNKYFNLPIVILSNSIIKVEVVKKRSDFEALYLEVTSGIVTVKEDGSLIH